MFQMGRKTGVFFLEEINEVCLEKITDTVLVANPGTIVLFDDLNVVASPTDNSRQMEKFGVLVAKLEP